MSDNTRALQVFQFEGNEIRTIMHKGEPWWVAKDICIALGLTNHRQAISMLSDQQKDCVQIMDAIGRQRDTNIISESGMYKLAFRSNKPEAERFTDWVASEVLPSIRKTGRYSIHQEDTPLQGSPIVDAIRERFPRPNKKDIGLIKRFIKSAEEYDQSLDALLYPDKQSSKKPVQKPVQSALPLIEKPAPTPESIQAEILRHLDRLSARGKTALSATGLRDFMPQYTRLQIEIECRHLVEQGVLTTIQTAHTIKYRRAEVDRD